MHRLRLQLLGGFSLGLGAGRSVNPGARKARALLAYLALPAGRTHSRDKLASLLWGDTGDEQARQSLRQTLVALRRGPPATSTSRSSSDWPPVAAPWTSCRPSPSTRGTCSRDSGPRRSRSRTGCA